MTFADELRSGKGLEKNEWTPSVQDKKDVEIILDMLKKKALECNKSGKHFVDGYLTYYGYDWDTWRLISIQGKLMVEDLGAGGFGVKKSDKQYIYLQSEIKKGLKLLGFDGITIQSETIQMYKKETAYFFKDWKAVKAGTEETLRIRFQW